MACVRNEKGGMAEKEGFSFLPGDLQQAGFLHILSELNDASSHYILDERLNLPHGSWWTGDGEDQFPCGRHCAGTEDWCCEKLCSGCSKLLGDKC